MYTTLDHWRIYSLVVASYVEELPMFDSSNLEQEIPLFEIACLKQAHLMRNFAD